MKYALLIYSPTTAEEYHAATTALRQPGAQHGPWTDYTAAAREAGVLLGAEQLAHDETATTLRAQADGERVITDGPFMETKEHLLGFYLIEAADLDAALDWARRMPGREGQSIEVRAALSGMPWQQALTG
jgi:hypothetical protein